MTETNFRVLCEELLQELCCCYKPWELKEGSYSDAMKRANAALAQPEPHGPTDEELEKLADDYMAMDGATGVMCLGHLDFARAALTRWGTPANNTRGTQYDG